MLGKVRKGKILTLRVRVALLRMTVERLSEDKGFCCAQGDSVGAWNDGGEIGMAMVRGEECLG